MTLQKRGLAPESGCKPNRLGFNSILETAYRVVKDACQRIQEARAGIRLGAKPKAWGAARVYTSAVAVTSRPRPQSTYILRFMHGHSHI